MKIKPRHIALAVLVAFIAACRFLALAADFYAVTCYPVISGILSLLSSFTAFSLEEIAVAAMAAVMIWIIISAFRHKCKWGRAAVRMAELLLWVAVWFYMGWGTNYFRSSIYARSGTVASEFDADVFNTFLADYTQSLNGAYESDAATDTLLLEQEIKQFYSTVPKQFGLSRPRKWQHAKKPLLNRLYSGCGVTGFMGPFLGESMLNTDLLPTGYAFTYAHEYAHLMGVSNEAEANYWAYRFCIASDLQSVRYSGYFQILPYVAANARSVLSPEQYDGWIAQIDPRIMDDYNLNRQHWSGLRWKLLDDIQSWLLDMMLKGNSIPTGIQNYSEVVALILAVGV